jgi:hypothetical protein
MSQSEKEKTTKRRWYRKRILRGICIYCPNQSSPKKICCDTCRSNRTRDIQEMRAIRKEAGLCVICSNPRGDDGTASNCRPCAIKKNESLRRTRYRRQQFGKCLDCTKDAGKYLKCRDCRLKRQTTYQQKAVQIKSSP